MVLIGRAVYEAFYDPWRLYAQTRRRGWGGGSTVLAIAGTGINCTKQSQSMFKDCVLSRFSLHLFVCVYMSVFVRICGVVLLLYYFTLPTVLVPKTLMYTLRMLLSCYYSIKCKCVLMYCIILPYVCSNCN